MTDWASFERAIASEHREITEGLATFLRVDTVSQERERVRRDAEWLAAAMRSRDLEADVLETGGNPAVFGRLRAPGARRTVLIYCHYDVNEHLRLDHLFQGVRTTAGLLQDLG